MHADWLAKHARHQRLQVLEARPSDAVNVLETSLLVKEEGASVAQGSAAAPQHVRYTSSTVGLRSIPLSVLPLDQHAPVCMLTLRFERTHLTSAPCTIARRSLRLMRQGQQRRRACSGECVQSSERLARCLLTA